MIKHMEYIIGSLFMAAAVLTGAYLWLSTPDVWVSHSTGECVKVVPADAGTCENLPDRYVQVWVK